MNIVFKHNCILPVKKYGGTERVLYWLMKELVIMGHNVSFIGLAGSSVKNIGVNFIELTDGWQKKLPKGIDILHFFGPDKVLNSELPYLYTVHGNGQLGETFNNNSVFVSKKHAENHNASTYVYNGIDFYEYPFISRTKRSWNSFCFLAKAKWRVKNLRDCIKVCKKNKKHLYVAGGRAWSLSRYIHSMGVVDDLKKLELLRTSDALLFPVLWHEPFGIAIIEAYSQGLPVIGSCFGSLPELLSPETGIIVNNYREFEEAVSLSKNTFDPEHIRKYAEEHFSSKLMAEGYLKLYKKVASGRVLNQGVLAYTGSKGPQTLLEF